MSNHTSCFSAEQRNRLRRLYSLAAWAQVLTRELVRSVQTKTCCSSHQRHCEFLHRKKPVLTWTHLFLTCSTCQKPRLFITGQIKKSILKSLTCCDLRLIVQHDEAAQWKQWSLLTVSAVSAWRRLITTKWMKLSQTISDYFPLDVCSDLDGQNISLITASSQQKETAAQT